jgi:hypothetical protein
MYDIAATVTTATPIELKLLGHWPLNWWRASGIKSTEIQRKLLPNEVLPAPLGPVLEEEIPGNRDRWPGLQVGDRVIVRVFFPGEPG